MAFRKANRTWRPACLLAAAVVSGALLSSGQDVADEGRNVDERRAFGRRVSSRVYDDVFDTELPVRYPEGLWSFHLKPKFGGWIDDDYMRLVMGVRYNLSRHFDAHTNLGTYFPNPINDGKDSGLYMWEVGARYSWLERTEGRVSVAAGINAKMPICDAPREITDGYARYSPFITFSQKLKDRPEWLYYVNTSFEFVDDSPFQDHPLDPQPRDRLFLRPGFIYYPGGPFRYSLELEYVTNALDFRDAEPPPPPGVDAPPEGVRKSYWILAHTEVHELIVHPAITWFPSRKTREDLFLPGDWDIGVRVDIPVVEETGRDIGLSVRLRWFFDHRKFIREEIPDWLKLEK